LLPFFAHPYQLGASPNIKKAKCPEPTFLHCCLMAQREEKRKRVESPNQRQKEMK